MRTSQIKLERVLMEQGRKKSWLASELQVNRSTITRWLKGETVPRKARRNKIAALLGLADEELF